MSSHLVLPVSFNMSQTYGMMLTYCDPTDVEIVCHCLRNRQRGEGRQKENQGAEHYALMAEILARAEWTHPAPSHIPFGKKAFGHAAT